MIWRAELQSISAQEDDCIRAYVKMGIKGNLHPVPDPMEFLVHDLFLIRNPGLMKLIADHAPKAVKEMEMKALFGRKVAVDASMSLYQFLVCHT